MTCRTPVEFPLLARGSDFRCLADQLQRVGDQIFQEARGQTGGNPPKVRPHVDSVPRRAARPRRESELIANLAPAVHSSAGGGHVPVHRPRGQHRGVIVFVTRLRPCPAPRPAAGVNSWLPPVLTRALVGLVGGGGRSVRCGELDALHGRSDGGYDGSHVSTSFAVVRPPEVAASRGSITAAAVPVMPQLCPDGQSKTGPDCVSGGQSRFSIGLGDRI